MARFARVVAPGFPHHISQRGNRRQQASFSPDDYAACGAFLGEQVHACASRIWGRRPMANHTHLIVVRPSESALRLAMGKTQLR